MFYVSMIDTFMSGWGVAKDKINIYQVACDNEKQAKTIKRNAQKRPEMARIKISTSPFVNVKDKQVVTNITFDKIGDRWKE